jgi:hypothetical protein
MTLDEIYEKYTQGSDGFIKAVLRHCGYDISYSEMERLSSKCPNSREFEYAWKNETWWTDWANHDVDLIAADEAEAK